MKAIKKIIFVMGMLFCAVSFAATVKSDSVYVKDGDIIRVTADNKEFTVKLKSNPTTGYTWFLNSYDANLLQVLHHQFEAPTNKRLVGAPGYELWVFRAKPAMLATQQKTAIRFVYARPWEKHNEGQSIAFTVLSEQGK